jgi:hypothetical protein
MPLLFHASLIACAITFHCMRHHLRPHQAGESSNASSNTGKE